MKTKFIQKTLFSCVFAISALAPLSSTAMANTHTPASNAQKQSQSKESFLFVLSAKSGELTSMGHHYRLILNHTDPQVLWFTDRPYRKSGFVSAKSFIANWGNSFKESPPNAAMAHAEIDTTTPGYTQQPIAVEISNPSWSDGQLSFEVHGLSGDHVYDAKFKRIALLIDPKRTFKSPHQTRVRGICRDHVCYRRGSDIPHYFNVRQHSKMHERVPNIRPSESYETN